MKMSCFGVLTTTTTILFSKSAFKPTTAFCLARIQSARKLENHPFTIVYRTRSRKSLTDTTPQVSTDTLDWEKFEFSASPKHDHRFDNKIHFSNAPTQEELDKMIQDEAVIDREHAKKLEQAQSFFTSLSPEIVASATKIMEAYVNEERRNRVAEVLNKRTIRSRFLFENPTNPSNVWACLRTIER